jgi:predicted DNA-binding transcriptional regulator YafY
MNKLERLAGIVFIMGRKGKIQARELAERFEVSERTIYRDIQALSELRVPIVAESGTGGGYSIAPGYFLRPVVFSDAECQALILGCEFISGQKGFPLAQPAVLALEKLESIMPEQNVAVAKKLAAKISYKIPVAAASHQLAEMLSLLKTAMENRQTIEVKYQALRTQKTTIRKIDVYRLFFEQDAWHILGFCHLRREVRQFKVARIQNLKYTGDTFQAEDWGSLSSNNSEPKEPILVKVDKESPTGRKLIESPSFQSFIRDEDAQALYLSFTAEWFSTAYIIETVLGFGKSAEIISPEDVRREFINEIREINEVYRRQKA